MILNMITPKNETGTSRLSITQNCETLIKQTHRKAEGTLDFKLTSRETFHFNPFINIERSGMIASTILEVYISIFNINYQNNKIELYSDSFDEFSFELEEIVNISTISHEQLQD